eukprot:356111-Chlamydomonas_euryale.AAC.7
MPNPQRRGVRVLRTRALLHKHITFSASSCAGRCPSDTTLMPSPGSGSANVPDVRLVRRLKSTQPRKLK